MKGIGAVEGDANPSTALRGSLPDVDDHVICGPSGQSEIHCQRLRAGAGRTGGSYIFGATDDNASNHFQGL